MKEDLWYKEDLHEDECAIEDIVKLEDHRDVRIMDVYQPRQ